MVNTFLDSMKSPWAKLVFSLSFHYDKFHEYEKKQELLFLAYHIIFPFLYQYETDVDTSIYHNHIRSSGHGNHRTVSYQLLCWTSFLLISEYKACNLQPGKTFFLVSLWCTHATDIFFSIIWFHHECCNDRRKKLFDGDYDDVWPGEDNYSGLKYLTQLL